MQFNNVFTKDKYESHQKWLETDGKKGERLDLQGIDLRYADLSDANLSGADMSCVNLSGANLQRANLQRANLQRADLSGADMYGANLSGADIDFASWPLWCGSFCVKVDKRIVAQLIYHVCKLDCNSLHIKFIQWILKPLANQFHRIGKDVDRL